MSEIVRIRRSTTAIRENTGIRSTRGIRPALAESAHRATASAADLALRGAWQLVGGYVWLVLLFKGPEPARRGTRFGHRRG